MVTIIGVSQDKDSKTNKADSEEDKLEDLNNKMKVTVQAMETLGSALDSRMTNREKDSAVTTGTEGTNNPVMAGKKVVKVRSQEQAEEDRKAAKIAQEEEDKKEAEKTKGDTDEYPAWHDKDPFY